MICGGCYDGNGYDGGSNDDNNKNNNDDDDCLKSPDLMYLSKITKKTNLAPIRNHWNFENSVEVRTRKIFVTNNRKASSHCFN
jgi:hypothetical protein